LHTKRAYSPFFPSFQHHIDFCPLALTLIQIKEDTELKYRARTKVFKYASTLLVKRDLQAEKKKKPVAQTLAGYSPQHPCEIGGRTSPFPTTGDKVESTDDISQGSKWTTGKAETQESLALRSLL